MTGRKWVPALAAVAVVAGASCQQSQPPVPTVEAQLVALPETQAAAPEVRSGRRFEPPADGRLTAAQVETYIAVRRQAMNLPKASTLAAQIADIAVSERRAASGLGQDVDEYRWVSAKVAEASPAVPAALGGLAAAIEASAREGRQQVLGKAAAERPAVTSGKPVPNDSARAYNRELLDRYRSELDALTAPSGLPTLPAGSPRS
jgi:hypothetical protein